MFKKVVNLALVLAMLLPMVVNAAPLGQEVTYTVKKGDTLWTLAEKYLGSGPAYHAIVMATNLKRMEDLSFAKIRDPGLIHPGWKLLIPSAEEAEKFMDIWYAGAKTKIAVVSDIGGRGDLSFNDMAFKGGDDAERDFGVKMVELISKVEADYVPNLTTAAKDPDVQLIVGVGWLLTDALAEVARKYPDKNFAGIDTSAQLVVKDKYPDEYPLPNLVDIVYEEHKGSALVGALGALLAAAHDKPHIGGVFGIEIPVLWKFEIGYKWGARWATEWLKENYPEEAFDYTKDFVLWTYTGTFSDITKGYEAAKPMYAKDAVAVYNIAGPLGLGINQAVAEIAEEKGLEMGPPFWIGVDADQDWINPGFIIASMMKRVDWGVYYATKLVLAGTFRDVVKETNGTIVLGIGTRTAGELMEGHSVSVLDDLPEFIAMGARAEELTGKKWLPMTPDEIRAKVAKMRAAQPAWVWEGMAELERQIRAGEVEVPLVMTGEDIKKWRDELG